MKQWLLLVLMSSSIMHSIDKKECMKNKSVYFLILAGGSGERLWPLSKQKLPKQLLSIGPKTFLHQAIERVRPLAASQDNIWVVTSQNHEAAIRACVGGDVGTILVEPGARNTGPAVLYSCLALQKIARFIS